MTDAQIIKEKCLIIEQLEAKNKLLESKLDSVTSQLEELKRLIFGRKSERFIPASSQETDAVQLSLFESNQQEDEQPVETESISYQRTKKKHPGRNAIPEHLPVEEIIIEPEQSTEGMVKIGEEVTETIEYTPASLIKRRVIRPKYVEKDGSTIHIASLPSRPLPKTIAEAGLLSHILVSKYVDHLPLYRLAKMFKRDFDWQVAQSTLVDWVSACCRLLEPLYNALEREVFNTQYIQADESPIKVLEYSTAKGKDPPGSKGNKIMQGYQWVYYSPEKKLVYFNYRKGRGLNGPKEVLMQYTGHVQCDGYQVYDKIGAIRKEVTLLGCLAHARRYFEKALDNDRERSTHALGIIRKVYLEERKAKELNDPKAHQEVRSKKILPKLKALKSWTEEQYSKVVPKSKIARAMYYYSAQWDKIHRAAANARFELDNNLIENKIRPLALGRKNYLFAGSHDGARRAAMLYSFFGSCMQMGINPAVWLEETLEKIPEYPINKITDLLPGYRE